MLQQTRVDVVVPYYHRFLARFPDVESLARAPLADVLEAWSGLGYYGRARNLHAAAREIAEDHAGCLPREPVALLALPGIGRYTAGAIRSIAFGEPAPILDGNVVRVLARLFGLDADVDAKPVRDRLWSWAAVWAAGRDPASANQALMDLGSMICTKPVPNCARCPLAADCVAARTGRERILPRPRRRPAAARIDLEMILAHRRGRLLLVRRSSGRLLRDWWEPPACRIDRPRGRGFGPEPSSGRSGAATARSIVARLHERLAVEVTSPRSLAAVRHAILNHRLEVSILAAEARASRSHRRRSSGSALPAPSSTLQALATLDHEGVEARWFTAQQCRSLPLSTLARKALRAAADHEPIWRLFLGQGAR